MRCTAVVVLLLSGATASAQTGPELVASEEWSNVKIESSDAVVIADVNNDRLELVIWFMGNKQFSPVSGDTEASTTIGKKSFINCGMKPNRILSKSFLKKAVNFENTVA